LAAGVEGIPKPPHLIPELPVQPPDVRWNRDTIGEITERIRPLLRLPVARGHYSFAVHLEQSLEGPDLVQGESVLVPGNTLQPVEVESAEVKHHQRESVDQDAAASGLKRPMRQAP